jgi:hypothetical protein
VLLLRDLCERCAAAPKAVLSHLVKTLGLLLVLDRSGSPDVRPPLRVDSSNLNLTLATQARYSSGPTKTSTISTRPSTTTAAAAAQEPIFSESAS